jgi:hypothetical protein
MVVEILALNFISVGYFPIDRRRSQRRGPIETGEEAPPHLQPYLETDCKEQSSRVRSALMASDDVSRGVQNVNGTGREITCKLRIE